jgi:competence protein ComEC
MSGQASEAGSAAGEDLVPPASRIHAVTAALEAERARWFCWAPVLFATGIGLYFELASEPPLAVALAPVVAALALRLQRPSPVLKAVGSALLLLAAGFAGAKLRTELVRGPVLEKRMGPVEARGFVELIEPRATRGVRITLRVTALGELAPESVPYRIRVRTLKPVHGLGPGTAVKVRATLAPPAEPAIPGGYDFARSAWFQGLGGVGYALALPEPIADVGPAPLSLRMRAAIEDVRQGIGARIGAALPGEIGAIATALITGERGGISPETNDAFRSSGLLHILSISGLHMVVMAGAVFYVLRLGLAAAPAIALRYPIKKWAAFAAAAAALAYLLISGAAFATVRSYIMISVLFLAVLLDRPALAMRNVAIAAFVILALYPESLLDIGFQMSFAAVVALVAAYEEVARRAAARDGGEPGINMRALLLFGGIALSTIVAGLAVAPFAAYHFHTSQQFALLANLIAIPICNLLVMPAALLTLVLMPFGLEAPALWAMGQGIEAIIWCARTAAEVPGAVLRIPAVPEKAFLMMVAGGLWLALWQARWRLLGLVPLAAGVALSASPRLPDILVGRDGALIAVRTADGRLSAAGGRQSGFELKRWLEHDGDGREPVEVAKAAGFRCDGTGCVSMVKDMVVALARHPAALADDCRRADILVLDFPAPKGCVGPKEVLDFFRLRRDGTHALFVEGPAAAPLLRIVSVAGERGVRPWAGRRPAGRMDRAAIAERAEQRVKQTGPGGAAPSAQPSEATSLGRAPRPEIEDDAFDPIEEPGEDEAYQDGSGPAR